LLSTNSIHGKHLFLLFIVAISILWLPAIFTPFWGDDYYFLMQAKEARLSGQSWIQPFFSESSTGFWRPLSMDFPWRIIERFLDGDPKYAHLFSLSIWLISLCALAYFAHCLSMALSWPDTSKFVLMAILIYSSSAIHILVLHWVSAINSSFLVIFSSLTLALWIKTLLVDKQSYLNSFLVLISLLGALFCKESAIMLPFLMMCVTTFIRLNWRSNRQAIYTFLFSILICLVWFYFFRQFTHSRHSSYELTAGINVIENGIALIAWMSNIPREAFRLILNGDMVSGSIWITAVALPAFIFFGIALIDARNRFNSVQMISIIFFVAFAYAPYLLLSKQSYEYYAAVAFILPAIFLAMCLVHSRLAYLAFLLFLTSSFISVQGSRMVDYPGLISRANWGEKQLQMLETLSIHTPLVVEVTNPHQFYAVGVKGLAWRLQLSESEIQIIDYCTQPSQMVLRLDPQGDYSWQACSD
jgi:hypothetical protein